MAYDDSYHLRSRAVNNAEKQTDEMARANRERESREREKEKNRKFENDRNFDETVGHHRIIQKETSQRREDSNRHHTEKLAQNMAIEILRRNTDIAISEANRRFQETRDKQKAQTDLDLEVIKGKNQIDAIKAEAMAQVYKKYATLPVDLLIHELDTKKALGLAALDILGRGALAKLESRLRKDELTHAEYTRLTVRQIEGANDRDAKKWAFEYLDEWERERKGRI